MGIYRVYNENYCDFGDLISVDFVEVDNTDVNSSNIYYPAVKNKLHIVNVKAADVANFISTNKVLTPTQVLQLNNKWNQGKCTFMQPYQYEQQKIKDEIRDVEEQNTFDKLHIEDNIGCSNEELMSMLSFDNFNENARNTRQQDFYEPKNNNEDDFYANLVDAERYCQTAVNAYTKHEEKVKFNRINGDTNEGRNTMIDRKTLDTSRFATTGIAIEPTSFDSTPFDFNIDVDSIFTSQPKKIDEATAVTKFDSINIENSFLMQGSCLDMFNQTVEKIGDAKIREHEHTIPAKLEKQRRIEEYHKLHNRKKNQ